MRRSPQVVDATHWLFITASDPLVNEWAKKSIAPVFGTVTLSPVMDDNLCGVIFVSEASQKISRADSNLIQYFFSRDGVEARVFEFDRFEGDFKARRWDHIEKRIR